MESSSPAGIAAFLAQTDSIGAAIIVALVLASIATWYLIVTKTFLTYSARRRSGRFLRFFWDAPSLNAVEKQLERTGADEPFSRLAAHAIRAARHHQTRTADKLDAAGIPAEFLTRAMRRVIDEETARLESGLTVLASIGSTAPFVGLFGTVWGVYHALVNIGVSGQGTLDKIAGPVGEALIMTAAGLAVAIPAVLAYNAFVRSKRVTLAQLDSFAHDLYAFLTTGSRVTPGIAAAAPAPVALAVKGAL